MFCNWARVQGSSVSSCCAGSLPSGDNVSIGWFEGKEDIHGDGVVVVEYICLSLCQVGVDPF